MELPPEAAGAPAHWVPYVLVEDVDSVTRKAEGLGARVHVAPRDIPGMGRFAVIGDTVGAAFAFFKGN
jgi:predicted enzyme related to lactoylglutathione lyase